MAKNSIAITRDIDLTPIAEEVLKKRYLARNYKGDILETPEQVFRSEECS
jgi:ribonucleotide reductase alpha subunit